MPVVTERRPECVPTLVLRCVPGTRSTAIDFGVAPNTSIKMTDSDCVRAVGNYIRTFRRFPVAPDMGWSALCLVQIWGGPGRDHPISETFACGPPHIWTDHPISGNFNRKPPHIRTYPNILTNVGRQIG